MSEENISIEIGKEIERFSEHIATETNDRILFSGIFGIGKTYFTKKFFELEKEKYEMLYLSPVNYSIAQTEDIFQYIKFDIIAQLLEKDLEFEKIEYPLEFTSQFYLKENIGKTAVSLLEGFGKLGRSLSTVYDNLQKLLKNLKQHNENSGTDEHAELLKYINEFAEAEHSIYEHGRTVEIINTLIQQLKSSNKEVVLVIDDLDRLDPEHIFRILNVFASHLDLDNEGCNKFGIDKVMLVCDIENVRGIYSAKYGADVDFNGYIDKFYSTEIFHLDNRKMIKSAVWSFLKTVKFWEKGKQTTLYQSGQINETVLQIIIEELISQDLLSIRSLLKLENFEFNPSVFKFRIESTFKIFTNYTIPYMLIFDFLIQLFGSRSNLKVVLLKLYEKTPSTYLQENAIHFLANFLTLSELHIHKGTNGEYKCVISELSPEIEYEIVSQNTYGESRYVRITKGFDSLKSEKFPHTAIIKNAYDVYLEMYNQREEDSIIPAKYD